MTTFFSPSFKTLLSRIKLLTIPVLLILLNTDFASAQLSRSQRQEIGIPGTTRPKGQKTKAPKIKYEFHKGKALLKTGLFIEGRFKYSDSDEYVPQYIFIEKGSKKKKNVALSMIEHMVLAGAEPGINNRPDSTEFVWIDKYKDLYRKVRTGKIEIFDNSRVVNESYEYLTEYVMLAGRTDYGYKLVRRLSDLSMLMTDRPYFMKSAKSTGRYETKDLRVVIYLVDLFNDPKPMRTLKWKKTAIKLRNGEELKGHAYIQPLDLRNEYTQGNNAFIHFFDGKEFSLYIQRDLKSVKIDNDTYEDGFYSISNNHFYGKLWKHDKSVYLVAKRIVNNNNYYFKNRTRSSQDLVILKEVADNYVKPVKEAELRKIYIEQLRNKATAEQ